MREQKGCISIDRENWVLRWRETSGEARKLRFKVLAPITADHRRNKDRKTGKLRIPDEIKALAKETMDPVATAPASILMTIGTFVTEYLAERKQTLKASSYNSYVRIWERYLLGRVSGEVLRDYKRPDCYLLWKSIQKEYSNLSHQTMQHIRFFLSGVFNAALNRGLYSGDNPAQADLPAGLRGRRETEAFTIDEINWLLSRLIDPQAQAIIALAFGSGMRKGELAAIRWDDYESRGTGAILHVRQSLPSNGSGLIVSPKTASSADDVHISSEIVSFMEAYREYCGKPDTGLIFSSCRSSKRPIDLDSFATWTIKPLLKLEGAPRWKGWHGFRRGNATYLAAQSSGDGVQAASLMLRHSNVSITENHYVKDTKQQRRARAARKVIDISAKRDTAAATIGAGLKQAQVN